VKRLALLSLVAVILVGCSDGGRPLVTLRTGVLRAQDYLPYFVIQEQGFDKRHGLRFVEQTFEGGAAVLAGLADGLLDAGPTAGSVPVLTAAEQGWIHDNPQEARLLLARRTSLGRDVAERINLLHWPRDARNAPELLDQMQQALVKARVLKAPIPARHLYDETLLTEVLKEKG